MWFLFGEVSSSSGCLGWATLFYCGTESSIYIFGVCSSLLDQFILSALQFDKNYTQNPNFFEKSIFVF